MDGGPGRSMESRWAGLGGIEGGKQLWVEGTRTSVGEAAAIGKASDSWAGPVPRGDVTRVTLVLEAEACSDPEQVLAVLAASGPHRAPWPSRRPMSRKTTVSLSTVTSFAPTCSGERRFGGCLGTETVGSWRPGERDRELEAL